MRLGGFSARHDPAVGDRDAGRPHHLFRALLVHGERGGQHARVRVGHADQLQQTLHAAILAPAAVQGIEAHLGLHGAQLIGEIAAHVDEGHLVAGLLQGRAARLARIEAHLALGGEAAHEHRDVVKPPRACCFTHCASASASASPMGLPGSGSPRRMISHCRVTPLVSLTRARTVSPSRSMSSPRSVAIVDQEVAVHFRHLGAADAKAPAPGRVDQLPGAGAGRVLERGAARALLHRLIGLAVLGDFAHLFLDLRRVTRRALVDRLDEDPVRPARRSGGS